MRELVNVMKALSDPGRVKVLKMLEPRGGCACELCACEIIGLLGLAQPTVSRHLKVLVDAGLITGRKVGSWVHYRLASDSASASASPYVRAMLAALPGWLEDDPEIKAMRRELGGLTPLALTGQQDCKPSRPQDRCEPAAARP
ncbi:MAG: metalloregulator ArsR/SmtB family transcription factor [Proteobacteria bacterium]|nr:metalloregulator ArsR/SmtB family transcription factor [Pseudomonadota bacterium]